jgi:hypothetical protein
MAAPPTTTTPPTLCRGHALWWSQAYGGCNSSAQQAEAAAAIDGFYRAIRDNRVELVQRFLADHPAAVFTKVGAQRGVQSSVGAYICLRLCGSAADVAG